MDTISVDDEANNMDIQSLKSYSESSEGSGINILTPSASEAGAVEAFDVTPEATPEVKPFENEADLVDEAKTKRTGDWVDDTTLARTGQAYQPVDMTLIQHLDETDSLGDSVYELIDDDIESSHGAETESISDCSISRPSDVVSLSDDEKSVDGTESEASISHSAIPAYAGLDHNEDTPRVGLSTANVHTGNAVHDAHIACLPHIAFEEPKVEGAETASQISVMHTVKEFCNEEADAIAIQIESGVHPRLIGTIRQTMVKEYLSLKEPLRIMYIGSHQARQDILQKLGSSVAASRDDKSHGVQSTQLYNVVPISAFGSGKTPEVELTQSSAVQFKICDLEKAAREDFSPALMDKKTITLTLDHNSQVRSSYATGKFEVEPKEWERPHLAVFYCSETDTAEMVATRQIANSFMQRHNIPRIIISHSSLFNHPMNMRLSKHPIHMCLESRDPAKSSNSIHYRLPIDLTSFLNIDARQMNRNLACITGLYDTPAVARKDENIRLEFSGGIIFRPFFLFETLDRWRKCAFDGHHETFNALEASVKTFNTRFRQWNIVQKVLLFVVITVLGFSFGYYTGPAATEHEVSHHNETVAAPIISGTISSTISSAISTYYSTTTRTTTITQTVTHAPTSTTVTPPKPTDQGPEPDSAMDLISSFITAELVGDREVVLRTTKANIDQMKKDANLAFRLWRESFSASQPCNNHIYNQSLAWEKAAWVDNGVSILLKKDDIHGSIKIGVESQSTDKRKIRKTYNIKLSDSAENLVTFGRIGKCVKHEVIPLLADDISRTFSYMSMTASRNANFLALKSQDVVRAARAKFNEAKLTERMARKMKKMKKVQAQIAKRAEKTEQMAEEVHKAMNEKLLKAQVKSRLIWLRKRGRFQEAKEYEEKAANAGVLEKVVMQFQANEMVAKERTNGQEKKKRCPRGIGRKARKCRDAARLAVH